MIEYFAAENERRAGIRVVGGVGRGARHGVTVADATMVIAPVFVFPLVAVRYLVSGMTAGAVEGQIFFFASVPGLVSSPKRFCARSTKSQAKRSLKPARKPITQRT